MVTRLNPYYPGKMAVIRKERSDMTSVRRALDALWEGAPPPVSHSSYAYWAGEPEPDRDRGQQDANRYFSRLVDPPPPPSWDYLSGPAMIVVEDDEVRVRTIPWWKFWR